MNISCFKAYDIRGRVPDELNEEVAWRIGRAYCDWLQPNKVVIGHDIRLSSPALTDALSRGLQEGGANVFDIGVCGTEEIYFATDAFMMDGGIVVTASHNPMDYNGMKLVRERSRPISGDSGLETIKLIAETGNFSRTGNGTREVLAHREDYKRRLLSNLDVKNLKPLKIVVNAGNGGAGAIIDLLEDSLPVQFVKVHHEPDGTFPNGVPNPLLRENRQSTVDAIIEHGADLGIAWDGDFDRCFFFDANGRFIEGYYIVGLLAEAFLQQVPGAHIIHDPRLTWNTIDIVSQSGGKAIQSKTGHAFIKESMRREDAVYGGEMSAHHYFRDFAYCDSGMLPWLLVIDLMSKRGKSLAEMVDERMTLFPASGEINRTIENPGQVLESVQAKFAGLAQTVDHTDGLSMVFDDWRFNLRRSNTEPVVRLNVESRGNTALMEEKTALLLDMMGGTGS